MRRLGLTLLTVAALLFSPSFSQAFDQRLVVEQNVQRKEYERQQAEKEGQAKLALANGQAAANLAVAPRFEKVMLCIAVVGLIAIVLIGMVVLAPRLDQPPSLP